MPQLSSPRLLGVACETNKIREQILLLFHLENKWFSKRSYNWTYKLYKRKSSRVILSEFLPVTDSISNSQIVCSDYCLTKLASVVKASFITQATCDGSYRQLFLHINSFSILLSVDHLLISNPIKTYQQIVWITKVVIYSNRYSHNFSSKIQICSRSSMSRRTTSNKNKIRLNWWSSGCH